MINIGTKLKTIKEILDSYSKEERSAFVLGTLYSQSKSLKEDVLFNEFTVEEIMYMILNQQEIPKPRIVERNTFITVSGEDFKCKCGGNIFGKYSNGIYECNSCQLKYEGE